MKKIVLAILVSLLFVGIAQASDLPLFWTAPVSNGGPAVTGYKIYMSTSVDSTKTPPVVTWAAGVDVGNITSYVYKNVPDTGLVLFMISAYNVNGETINRWAGPWWDGTKQPLGNPTASGISR